MPDSIEPRLPVTRDVCRNVVAELNIVVAPGRGHAEVERHLAESGPNELTRKVERVYARPFRDDQPDQRIR